MEEEIIQDQSQEQIKDTEQEEQQIEDTQQQQQQQQQQNNEEEEDIEEITFDDEELVIAGYDLNSFKETLNVSDYPSLEQYLTEAKELGFTQEQIEWMIKKDMEVEEEQPKPKTKREIQKYLAGVLTREEKENYQSIKGFVAKRIANNKALSSKIDEIMSNPSLIALLNEIYKGENSQRATGKLNSRYPKPAESKMGRTVSLEDAQIALKKALLGGEFDKTANEYLGKVNDVEGFKQILRAMGKLDVLK